MSLNWMTTSIEDCETVCSDGNGKLGNTTWALVWAAVVVGINEITEATAPEFWARLSMHQKLFGPINAMPYALVEPVILTEDDVRRHIGLWTNASSLTITKFLKVMMDLHRDVVNHERARAQVPA